MSIVSGGRSGVLGSEGVLRVIAGSVQGKRRLACVIAAVCALLAVPTVASAHIERASYWPDPAPDCSITPCAGGDVPVARSLASAT